MRTIINDRPAPVTQTDNHISASLATTSHPHALRIIERAIRRGDVLEIGSTAIRFLRQKEEFQEGADCFEALQTGLYQRLAVFNAGSALDGPPDRSTWLFLTDLGQYELIVTPLLDALSHVDREALLVGITFRTVMLQIQQERAGQRLRSQRRTEPPRAELDCAIDPI